MTEPARILSWITPVAPWGADPPESPVERAAQSALMSVADFYVALHTVKTVEEALNLHRIIEDVLVSVECASRAALLKANSF